MSGTSRLSSSYDRNVALAFPDATPGTITPDITRSVSRLQLTLYCAAIRFVHQVHFDDDLCRSQGWDGVILPGFLMGNWCLEAVTRMLGPRSVVTSISFKMASVAYPNSPLRVRGEITDSRVEADNLHVTCSMDVVGEDDGVVTKATVSVRVPTS